jgi:hypothetical protein
LNGDSRVERSQNRQVVFEQVPRERSTVREKKMESKRFLNALPLVALAVGALTLLIAGCAAPAEVKEQGTNLTDPFSSRSEGENGIVVEWSGYTHGHQPGKGSAFALMLRNGSQDVWQGRYCIQLLDRQSVVATLKRREFSLQPGKDWHTQESIHFPDGLSEGAYGLALAIPGRLSSVVTIQVGRGTGAYSVTWPEPTCQ